MRNPVVTRLAGVVTRVVSLAVVLRSGLFDLDWYLRQVPQPPSGRSRRFPRWMQLLWFAFHYVVRGARAGRSPNPLFEGEWFAPAPGPFVRRAAKTVTPTGAGRFVARLDPFARYLLRGGPTLASPHPLFDAGEWVRRHPEAAGHRRGPLHHFMSVARDDTPMPLPRATGADARPVPFVTAAAGRSVTWGQARAELESRLDTWCADQRRARAKRFRDEHDAAADAALVARWEAAPPPSAGRSRPLVSVVMPVRNRPVQVVDAIASVRAQTLADWELVVVDDGSVDHTADVVAGVVASDPRVRLVHGVGEGVSAARNLGAEHATGRYIAWLDSDNTWGPHYLRTILTAMETEGWQAAYAAVEAIDGDRKRYRSLDPGPRREDLLALLEVANHIDLNVLVLRREVYDAVGGFDVSLRRTVDYDLIWRVAERERIHHLPFVGVRYVEDAAATDRITATELMSWREVVKNNHLIDWAALAAAAPSREEDLLSVLVAARGGWLPGWSTLSGVLADPEFAVSLAVPESDGPGSVAPASGDTVAERGVPSAVEVVVVDDAGTRASAMMLGSVELLDPRARVSRTPRPVHRALATNLALARSRGAWVVLAEAGVRLWSGWPAAAFAAAAPDSGMPRVVQPLLLDATGLVQSAGKAFTGRGPLPADLLAGHPVEDVEVLGATVPLRAAADAVALVRASDLIGVRGLDCLYVEGVEIPDLCLRLAPPDARVAVLAVGSRVQRPAPPRVLVAGVAEQNGRLFAQRWGDPVPPSDDDLWHRAGFARVTGPGAGVGRSAGTSVAAAPELTSDQIDPRVDGVEPGDEADEVRTPATADEDTATCDVTGEVTRRLPRPCRVGETPCLRWAIKTATPVGPAGEHWGDLHFAGALKRALEGLGQEVVVDRRESIRRATSRFDDVDLVLRGLQRVEARPGAVNLLWVISHPERVVASETAGYDRVFAAGVTWSETFTTAHGVPVTPLLQATDPHRFTPASAEPDTGEKVLFVGNSRNVHRAVVRHLVEAGVDVAVYGTNWEQYLPAGHLRGTYLPNAELAAHYRAAGIVLNDHWDDMREQGFVSNRLFDAVASGARVVSDHIDGLDAVFGGQVRTFRTPQELVDVVSRGRSAFPDDEAARATAERVAREHSFAARAATLLEAALAVRAPRSVVLGPASDQPLRVTT